MIVFLHEGRWNFSRIRRRLNFCLEVQDPKKQAFLLNSWLASSICTIENSRASVANWQILRCDKFDKFQFFA